MKKLLLFSIVFSFSLFSVGQSSTLGNVGGPGDFLGWEASVNTDVLIYQLTPGQPRIFGTDNTERMRISGDVNQSLLINVQNSSFSKVRVFQDRGFGAVNARIDNYQQETSWVRGLICSINAPYTGPINIDEIGIHAFVDGNSSDYLLCSTGFTCFAA